LTPPHTCAIAMTQSVHESNRIGLQLALLLVENILMASVLKGKNPTANKILFVLFGFNKTLLKRV
jgi:hypothetical protein